jgi:hypothetical protein
MVDPRARRAWTSACRARVRAARPSSGGGAACCGGGPGSGCGGGSCRQERWRATARSTASARLCHRCHRVGHLGCQRGALGCAFGVAAAAVQADDLHAGVGVQPGPERFRGPLREHVDRPAALDIDQHRAVDVPLAQGKVIHAEHQRSPVLGVGRSADQPQQRGPAGRARQPAALPAGRRFAGRSGWSGPGPARRTWPSRTRRCRRRTGGRPGE